MKKLAIILILVFCPGSVLVFATEDPNSLETKKNELVGMVKEFPQRKRALEQKVYNGTISEILAQRVVDVNEVITFSETIDKKAVELCKEAKFTGSQKEFLQTVIKKYNEKQVEEEKKKNNEFLSAVDTLINDPNNLPAEDDPNYPETVARYNEIMTVAMELADPL